MPKNEVYVPVRIFMRPKLIFFVTYFKSFFFIISGFPSSASEAEDAVGPPLFPPLPGGGQFGPPRPRLDHAGLPEGLYTQGRIDFRPERTLHICFFVCLFDIYNIDIK